ncbi:hypothetical protein Tco_0009527 [Tanacetum coccineum]
MKNRKCRTKGSTKPLVKCKLVHTGSSSRYTHQKSSLAKAESFAFLTISNDEAWKGHLDHQSEVELLDLHDHCYARQAVIDHVVNHTGRELLKVVDQMKEFDNNLAVNVLRQKIKSLSDEVAALEAEKGKLEAAKASLHQEVEAVKCDRAEVVSKVVPYVSMELVHSDEMYMLVGKLVSSAIFYERCDAFEEVANLKEPFDLAKVKSYKPSYKKEHTKAGNDLAAATFPFLSEVIADLFASVKALLSKKSKSPRHPNPTKTHALASSAPSQKATPFIALSPSLCLFYLQFKGHRMVVVQFQG